MVKIRAASLCHSDLMMDLRPKDFGRPMTMGHEGVGYIEKMHPSTESKGFKVGDKIGFLYIVDCCFECEGCQAHGTLCEKPNPGGAKVKGLMTDGFFSEFSLCDWENAIHLPDSLPIERMSPLFCAGITGSANSRAVCPSKRLTVNQRFIPSTSVSSSQANGLP